MKMDKEALKKNKFWIGLGVFVVLWLVGIVMVKVMASTKPKEEYETAKKEIDGAWSAGPKTEAYQKPWNAHGNKFKLHKDKVWADAWALQAGMYTWPDGMKVIPLYPSDTFGADSSQDLNNRSTYKSTLYLTQFTGLDSIASPAELAGGLSGIMKPVNWDRRKAPTREEIWLAQEDFWVRREMLYIVADALARVCYFVEDKTRALVPTGKDKKADAEIEDRIAKECPKGTIGRRVFKNANWEMTLYFEKGARKDWVVSGKSLIKNVNPEKRTLLRATSKNGPLPFRLVQGNSFCPLRVAGKPLGWKSEDTLVEKPDELDPKTNGPKVFKTSPVDVSKDFDLVQVLEWDISPVRRIEALELGKHSHRTANLTMKIWEELKKLDPDPEGEAKPAEGTTKPPAEGTGGAAPGPSTPMPNMGKGGTSGAAADATKINALPRPRYQAITDQARHLPVAMRLIVEQSHIHDVLAAVVSSRLRIQVTQVQFHHVKDVARPGDDKVGNTGDSYVPGKGLEGGYLPPAPIGLSPGMPRTPMLRPGGSGKLPPAPVGGGPKISPGMTVPGAVAGAGPRYTDSFRPGMFAPGRDDLIGADPTGKETKPAQESASLVELTVYGIASLYGRFPPKPPTTTPTDKPADKK